MIDWLIDWLIGKRIGRLTKSFYVSFFFFETMNSLAFSPDNRHMYVSYQDDGFIYDITREDGYPFGAQRLDIKYHAS